MKFTSDLTYPVIIAHRGFKRKYPENTLTAFEASIDAGAKMIELDVTLSRDRKVLVIHDDTLDRTTNGKGPVQKYTLAELRRLDAGSWFDSRFKGEQIPTLEEVLGLIKNRILLNIEIKKSAYEPNCPDDAIEKQVVGMVSMAGCLDSVLFSSFESAVVKRIVKIENRSRVALLTKKPLTKEFREHCKDLNPFSWNPDYRSVTRSLVQEMQGRNIRVFPYTVNSLSDAKRLVEMGVDGFFTDDPALMISLL
jgi:glycerophosphoryl diester phosphodiesterase